MTVSLLKLVKSDVKKMDKLTLAVSSLTAPGGVEVGPVQVLMEQAGAGSSPALSTSSPLPGLASESVSSCLAGLQVISWADRLCSTRPNSQIHWDGYFTFLDSISL